MSILIGLQDNFVNTSTSLSIDLEPVERSSAMVNKFVVVIILIIGLVAGYNLISQIIQATKSGERLSEAADAVYRLEIKNKELKNKLENIQSPQFIEEEVRNKLGFGKAGETMVIIPDEKIKQILGASESAAIRLPNWLGWWKVFFR